MTIHNRLPPGQAIKQFSAGNPQGESNCCIVCGASQPRFFASADGRDYLRCDTCRATYLSQGQRLSAGQTFARYRQHRNDPADRDYRRFLAKLADPLLERLPPRAHGLDYGCGPGPALACMLREAGHHVSLFDLYFFPDPKPLKALYDFITCTETIEHFHRPFEEFARFNDLLRPGGWLAVMTCFQNNDDLFAFWHYRRDPTHVVFYHEATLRHIAGRFGWSCEVPVKDVALMQKPRAAPNP